MDRLQYNHKILLKLQTLVEFGTPVNEAVLSTLPEGKDPFYIESEQFYDNINAEEAKELINSTLIMLKDLCDLYPFQRWGQICLNYLPDNLEQNLPKVMYNISESLVKERDLLTKHIETIKSHCSQYLF